MASNAAGKIFFWFMCLALAVAIVTVGAALGWHSELWQRWIPPAVLVIQPVGVLALSAALCLGMDGHLPSASDPLLALVFPACNAIAGAAMTLRCSDAALLTSVAASALFAACGCVIALTLPADTRPAITPVMNPVVVHFSVMLPTRVLLQRSASYLKLIALSAFLGGTLLILVPHDEHTLNVLTTAAWQSLLGVFLLFAFSWIWPDDIDELPRSRQIALALLLLALVIVRAAMFISHSDKHALPPVPEPLAPGNGS